MWRPTEDKKPVSKDKKPVASIKPGTVLTPVTPGMLANMALEDRSSVDTQRLIRELDDEYANEDERSLSHLEAEQARAAARRLSITCNVLISCAGLVGMYVMFVHGSPAGFLLVFPVALVGRYLQRRRSRILAPLNIVSYERTISSPFVLFLRPFGMDDRKPRWDDPFASSMEMEITLRMQKAGWVVAVGRPEERTPAPGANRLYIRRSDWESKVSELIKRARVVVLAVDKTDGVLWELRQSFRLLSPEKLILFLPFQFESAKKRAEIWSSVRSIASESGINLPTEIASALFITFTSNWYARVVEPVLPPAEKLDSDLRQSRLRRGIIEAMSRVFPGVDFETYDDALSRGRSVGFVTKVFGSLNDRIRKH